MRIIRKIAIGPDYKQAMAYQVGQVVLTDYVIHDIKQNNDGSLDVYICKGDEVIQWKSFSNTVPVSIEYKIDF